jgi:hypothetical protein
MQCLGVSLGNDQRLIEPEMPNAFLHRRCESLPDGQLFADTRFARLLLTIEPVPIQRPRQPGLAADGDFRRLG